MALFRLGKIVTTLTAQDLMFSEDVTAAIHRHQLEIGVKSTRVISATNDQAPASGRQRVSMYSLSGMMFFSHHGG